MKTFLLILELAGTLAFSASGALIGMKKNMDIFGVAILGLVTAVGGGVIRDVILGCTPPATFQNPLYAAVALVTALVLFLPQVRRRLMKNPLRFERVLFWMDTAGLGIFTAAGIRAAYGCCAAPSLFLLVFVGVITGVGGGLLRDVMAGNTPYIFVKHVYASASLAGALVCGTLWQITGEMPSMMLGAGTVILIRCLSSHYRWNLPKARD